MAVDYEAAKQRVLTFRDERDWSQFHNPKDLAISLSLEASELLECFQWSGDDLEVPEKRSQLMEELADVVIYAILLADRIDADIPDIVSKKIDINGMKYPIDKAKGSSAKYTEL